MILTLKKLPKDKQKNKIGGNKLELSDLSRKFQAFLQSPFYHARSFQAIKQKRIHRSSNANNRKNKLSPLWLIFLNQEGKAD